MDEISGRTIRELNSLEVFRRQTIALRDYLRWAKDKVLPKGKTSGDVAVELYLANDAAIKNLFALIGIDPNELKP